MVVADLHLLQTLDCDVRVEEQVRSPRRHMLERFGAFDLVNNAGLTTL